MKSDILLILSLTLTIGNGSSIIEVSHNHAACYNQSNCITLPECLLNVAKCFSSNTIASFESYATYSTGNVSRFAIIIDVTNLTLKGDSTVINCEKGVGFAFIQVNNLHLSGLHFKDCGITVPNSLRRFVFQVQTNSDYYPDGFWYGTKVALFMVNIFNLNITALHVNNSYGFGLFCLNVLGESIISDSVFAHNNYRAIFTYEGNLDKCRDFEYIGTCSGGNFVLVYQETIALHLETCYITVMDSIFEHGANLQNWDAALLLYPAGGFSIFSGQSNYSVDISVVNCIMDSNIGQNGGNSVVYLHDKIGRNSYILFDNTKFMNGNAELKYYADISITGGMYIYTGICPCDESHSTNTDYYEKHLQLSNCTFVNNHGRVGGALYITSLIDDGPPYTRNISSRIHMQDCIIEKNFGYRSILGAQELHTNDIRLDRDELNTVYSPQLIIRNIRLNNNEPLEVSTSSKPLISEFLAISNSTVFLTGLTACLLSNFQIISNKMRGLHVKSTVLNISGENYISGNVATEGGGIKLHWARFRLLDSYSYLYIDSNVAISNGGGIYVDTSLRYSCFYDVNQHDEIHQTQVFFRNNSAMSSGNSIYGGYIAQCFISITQMQYITGSELFWKLFDIPWQNSLTEVTSDVQHLCFCENGTPQCDIHTKQLNTFPGQRFQIPAVGVGQLNGTTPAIALSRIANSSVNLRSQEENTQQLGVECGFLRYGVNTTEEVNVEIQIRTNFRRNIPPDIVLSVFVNKCPLGFILNEMVQICDCIDFLSKRGVRCFIDNQSFYRQDPLWLGYKSDSENSLILVHDSCPFNYCETNDTVVLLNDTDIQCAFGHSGVLCGGCKLGLSSVFGSSHCKVCSDKYIAYSCVFILAGLILVTIMTYGDFTISKGTLNGLILYANIVRVHHTIFFPVGYKSPLDVFIAWLNLDFGIELCFYDGMDAYGRLWLQYLFPGFIWLIILLIILLSWHLSIVAKIAGTNAIQVLATLMLLSYTKLQRIILESLSFTFIRTNTGESFPIWLYDGNIPVVSVKYIMLCITALVVSIAFIVPFTLIILCEYPLQAKFGKQMLRFRCTPLIDAYQGPYKIKYRWWTGGMLVFRTFLLLAFGLNVLGDPRINLLLIISTCIGLIGVMWNIGAIYKQRWINAIETFYIINLGLLAAWTEYNRLGSSNNTRNQHIISYIFVGSAFLVFIGLIGYHICLLIRRFKNWRISKNHNQILEEVELHAHDENVDVNAIQEENSQSNPNQIDLVADAKVKYAEREPLLYETN